MGGRPVASHTSYAVPPLPYQLLAYNHPAVTAFATLPQLLAKLRSTRPPSATEPADQGVQDETGPAAEPSVAELEDQVRAVWRTRSDDGEKAEEDWDSLYDFCAVTDEYALFQGEQLRLQKNEQQQPVLVPVSPQSSSSPPPAPIAALRFPVTLFWFDQYEMHAKVSRRFGPSLYTFYEPLQLSVWLWERPDATTEGSGGNSDDGVPDSLPDDPLPQLVQAMQTKGYGGDDAFVVLHATRRIDWTAAEEQNDGQWQEQRCRRAKSSQEGAKKKQQSVLAQLSAEEEQCIRELMTRFRACRHPTRDTNEYEERRQQRRMQLVLGASFAPSTSHTAAASASNLPQPPDSITPPSAALITLLRATLDTLVAEQANCAGSGQGSRYWTWLGQSEQWAWVGVMDDVLPSWMELDTKHDEKKDDEQQQQQVQEQGWDVVQELLASIHRTK